MPEAGGTTTQSGILYQNSVAALFLGRLCDAAPRPDRERVMRVRVEAPALVDDTIVTFADKHDLYIQAKENVRAGDDAWKKLWHDFAKQFHHQGFQYGHDRLALYTGTVHEEHHVLRELCERARGKDNYAEWWNSLNEAQQEQVTRLRYLVGGAFTHDTTLRAFMGNDEIREFFSSIEIVIWTREHIERDLVHSWMPLCNQAPWTLFRLLRDRIGGEARIRQAFAAPILRDALREDDVELHAPIDINDLHSAVQACCGLLRQHKHTIAHTERHIRRRVIDDIIGWLRDPSDEKRVSLLLDQAGMGKTVVMRDVLCDLENDNITVLAIKADQQFSGISRYSELAVKLQLPEPVERTVHRLCILGPVVILIDQIDALSLSLARDQTALNIVLELIARLRLIPGVKILISCRTFDYRTDPQLKQVDVRTPFQLTPLSDEEIKDILHSANIYSDSLPNPTLQLLRTPLHLDLYVQVFGRHAAQSSSARGPVALTSLQDLYHLLWNEIVLKIDPDGPPDAERVLVLQLLTDYMDREQQTSAPQTLFLTLEHRHLQLAVRWLASAGILLATGPEWIFLHQTFFDYCYARQFVETGRDLVQTVLQSEQGLRARPQMIQVLAYVRGRHTRQYLRSLKKLLLSENLRYHLKNLLTRWFGALTIPSSNELTLAQQLLLDPTRRAFLLTAMAANPDWFARLSGTPLQSLLAVDDQSLDQQVIPYLASLIDLAQPEIVAVLKPYLGQSDAWNRRIAWTILRTHRWYSHTAAELLEQVIPLIPDAYTNFLHELHEIARAFPQHGCRFLRSIFEQVLVRYQIKRQEASQQREAQEGFGWLIIRLQSELEQLNNYVIVETLSTVSSASPGYFVETLLPWLEHMLRLSPVWPDDRSSFSSDELDSGWYDNIYPVCQTVIRSLIKALAQLALTAPELFHQYVDRLARLPYDTPQRLLACVYRAVPEEYAAEALQFLLADRRRLNLGEMGNRYETRELIRAIYPHLNHNQQVAFEEAILSWSFTSRPRDLDDLTRRGAHQLMLLQAVPENHFTERGRRYFRELERKFPNFKTSDDPRTSHGGFVGSPISSDSARHMSDRDWLHAMQHYSGNVTHYDFLKGGAQELSRVLQDLIKEQPERFYQLLDRIPDTVDDAYVTAYVNGLADSHASVDWFFAVVQRFCRQPNRRIATSLHWALAKRAETALPDDILSFLEDSVYADSDNYEQAEQREGRELYNAYLNSERGTAFRALMSFLRQCGNDPEAIDHRWRLVEYVSVNPSSILRAGAVEELYYLMALDRVRSVTLFEQLLHDHESLLCSYFAGDFIYRALYMQFARIQPYIRLMMNANSDACRQRGAELACIAAISPQAMETEANLSDARAIAEETLTGDTAWRRGAARIYAFNIVDGPREQCTAALRTLLNDEDAQVRQQISSLFHRLRTEHMLELQSFIEEFAGSRAFQDQPHFFAEYLWENSTVFPELTLLLIDIVLKNAYTPEQAYGGYRSAEEFIRSVLRVYNDPISDEVLQQRAMDIFDRLMERFPDQSQQVLEEWDRR